MKKNCKSLYMVIVGLALATCLFANGSNETKEKSVQASTELNLLFPGTPQIHEKEYFINDYIKGFEDKYNVKVNVDFVPQADGVTKIQTQQETGNTTTDVVYAHTANMAPYISGGWMEDITSLVKATGSTYTTMFDETTNKNGIRYFVPNMFDVYILIANVKALPYLPDGLTKADVEKGISWDQYAQWAINIAKGEGVGKTMLPASSL